MRSLIIAVAIGTATTTISGCAYPAQTVTQGGQTSALAFTGFSESAIVMINGETVGLVGEFDGRENTLAVPTGTNLVEVVQAGQTAFSKRVYVGRNSTLTLSPE